MAGLVKNPGSQLRVLKRKLMSWPTGRRSLFFGFTKDCDGMFSNDGMRPMMVGLQDPSRFCWPFVMAMLSNCAQKLAKLFPDVNEATCPAVGSSWPSLRAAG